MGIEFGTGSLSLQIPDLSTGPKIHLLPDGAEIPLCVHSAVKGAHLSHKLRDFSTTFNGLLCHQGELKSAKKGKISSSPARLPNTSVVSQSTLIFLEKQEQTELQHP